MFRPLGDKGLFSELLGESAVRRASVPYDVWYQQGYLMATEGNVIHYGFIEKIIEAVSYTHLEIKGYRLLFKKSKTGCYATIEQDANESVPAVVWKLSEYAELLLCLLYTSRCV